MEFDVAGTLVTKRIAARSIAALLAGAWFAWSAAAGLGETDRVKAVEKIAPRIESVEFHSRVLRRPKRFCVVLPTAYRFDRDDWPVLFLLHGRGRHERSLIDDARARSALLEADFVIVLPDGDNGWYVDSPVRAADRYATYLEEVIHVAQIRYHLSRDRRRRALSGWSMGGYGCVRFAQSHNDRFISVAPMIGLLDYPRAPAEFPPGQSYPVATKTFGDDPTLWKQFNPIHDAAKLRGMSILLITARNAFDRTMNENFRKRLIELKIPGHSTVLCGKHTLEVVRESIPIVLKHTRKAFRPPTQATGS